MSVSETKVIGYFAYRSQSEVACDEDACIVAGSEEAMRHYLKTSSPEKVSEFTIRKTRFGEIIKGMSLGAAYAFDEDAYERFYPLAREEGLPAPSADFTGTTAAEIKFMTVRLTLEAPGP